MLCYRGHPKLTGVYSRRYIVGYMVENYGLGRRVSVSDDIPPQMNMVIPILIHFLHLIVKCTVFAPNVSFVGNINKSQATSLMASVLRRYIAEYTDANS